MRLTSARQSIHDAFALHLGGPTDNLGSSGGKFNSTKWLANAGTAGLIIKAVMNQTAHLRSTAIFLNAPENTITGTDIIITKAAVWAVFIQKNQVSPQDQGVLIGMIDRIFMGYRSRVWDHNTIQHTLGAMFFNYGKERCDRLTDLANKMVDVLHKFDDASLRPVQEAINAVRDAESEAQNQTSAQRQQIAQAIQQGATWKEARKQVEGENARTDDQAA